MFKGSLPALVTPFRNGELDLETLKKLVEWHVGEGSNGLVPVGTTGESPTLTLREHEIVVEEVVKAAAGRIQEWLHRMKAGEVTRFESDGLAKWLAPATAQQWRDWLERISPAST